MKRRILTALLALVFLLPCTLPCLAAEAEPVDYADLFKRMHDADEATIERLYAECYRDFLTDPEGFVQTLALESEEFQQNTINGVVGYGCYYMVPEAFRECIYALSDSEDLSDAQRSIVQTMRMKVEARPFELWDSRILALSPESESALRKELEIAFLADPTGFMQGLSLIQNASQNRIVDFMVSDQWQSGEYSAHRNAVLALAQSEDTQLTVRWAIMRMLRAMGEVNVTVRPIDRDDYAELISLVFQAENAEVHDATSELKGAFLTDPDGVLQALAQESQQVQEHVAYCVTVNGWLASNRTMFCQYISQQVEVESRQPAERQIVQKMLAQIEAKDTWSAIDVGFADLFARAYQNPWDDGIHQELNSAFSAAPYALVYVLSQEKYQVQYGIIDVFRRYWNQNGLSVFDEATLQTLSRLSDRTQAERRVIRWLLTEAGIDTNYAVYQDPVDYGELFPRTFQGDGYISDMIFKDFGEAFLVDPTTFIRALALESSTTQTEIAGGVMLSVYYFNYDREYVRIILNTIEREVALTSAEKQVIGLMWDSVDHWIQEYGPLSTEPEPEPEPTEPEPTDPEPTETEPPAPSESTAPEPVPTETIPSGEDPESDIPGWVLPAVLIVVVLGIAAVVLKVLPTK